MYRVFLEDNETEECKILDTVPTEKEVYKVIREYAASIGLKIYYIRQWPIEENETKYDFGSYTKFIIAEEIK